MDAEMLKALQPFGEFALIVVSVTVVVLSGLKTWRTYMVTRSKQGDSEV